MTHRDHLLRDFGAAQHVKRAAIPTYKCSINYSITSWAVARYSGGPSGVSDGCGRSVPLTVFGADLRFGDLTLERRVADYTTILCQQQPEIRLALQL
jgi:hypothetical protein